MWIEAWDVDTHGDVDQAVAQSKKVTGWSQVMIITT